MTILLEDVSVKYHSGLSLDHINLKFENHEQWALLGENGSGKSTLLKAIMGLVKPIQGQIKFIDLSPKSVAYLSQIVEIDASQPITVYEFVAMGLWSEIGSFKGISKEQQERVLLVLNEMNLYISANRFINELSRGQLQKVLIARLLLKKAEFYILDEPFNAIDSESKKYVYRFIEQLKEQNKGLIIVVHDFNYIRNSIPNTIILNKSVKFSGPTATIDFTDYEQGA